MEPKEWVANKIKGLKARKEKLVQDVYEIERAIAILEDHGEQIAPIFKEIKKAGLI